MVNWLIILKLQLLSFSFSQLCGARDITWLKHQAYIFSKYLESKKKYFLIYSLKIELMQ